MRTIKWLNWRGRRSVFIRGKEIKEILEGLSQYSLGIKEDRDLAREEFRGAVQRYVLGFYEDSIYHSLFSVEMGLLIRLNEVLPAEDKKALHDEINKDRQPLSFTFGAIKSKSEQNAILHGSAVRLSQNLLRRRNSHIHAHNFISATISIQRRFLQEDSLRLAEEEARSLALHGSSRERKTARFFLFWLSRTITPETKEKLEAFWRMSDFQWCSKDRIRQTVELDAEEFLDKAKAVAQEVASDLSPFRFWRLVGSFRRLQEYAHPEAYMKKRAYDTLKDSYTVLTSIEII